MEISISSLYEEVLLMRIKEYHMTVRTTKTELERIEKAVTKLGITKSQLILGACLKECDLLGI